METGQLTRLQRKVLRQVQATPNNQVYAIARSIGHRPYYTLLACEYLSRRCLVRLERDNRGDYYSWVSPVARGK